MAAKNKLRGIGKQLPKLKDLADSIWALRLETDANAVILGTSLLDGVLEDLWKHKLDGASSNDLGHLFENRGALSDLNSKILLAKALKIISPARAGDLHYFRNIRNAFAHSRVPLSLNTPEVRKSLESTSFWQVMRENSADPDKISRMPIKELFVLALTVAIFLLDAQHRSHGGERLFPGYFPETKSFKSERERERQELAMIIEMSFVVSDPDRLREVMADIKAMEQKSKIG